MTGMDAESGMDLESGLGPELDAFLLARIAEDKRVAEDAAADSSREHASAEDALPLGGSQGAAAEFLARFDPAHVLTECAAKRNVVLACREAGPDMKILGARARGMADFPVSPDDEHQLAALTLALLALPYADHHDYRQDWRP
jgi:hypothetical protein